MTAGATPGTGMELVEDLLMLGMSEDSVKSSNKIQKNRSDHVVITKMAEHG